MTLAGHALIRVMAAPVALSLLLGRGGKQTTDIITNLPGALDLIPSRAKGDRT